MAHTKHCNKCGNTKPTTEFSKKTASKDGLQSYCKSCNSKDNHLFRKDINPEHHAKWQKENYDRVKELVTQFKKAKECGRIYYIQNPAGFYYIGQTKTPLSVRITEHKTKYRRQKEGKIKSYCPLLYKSIDKWGFDNHEIGTLLEFDNISRKELLKYERTIINTFKELRISLNIK
jgi:uncharacterized protein (UPF0305 family)